MTRHITPALLRRWRLPALDTELGKEARGTALVVAGSDQNAGAALLAALGVLRAGAGTLQIATTNGIATSLAVAVPEARVIGLPARRGEIASTRRLDALAKETDTLLVGPGIMAPQAVIGFLQRLAAYRGPIVVDAGALQAFARPLRLQHAVITPHAGEMAKLCDTSRDAVLADPCAHAVAMAKRLRVVVALKGARTYVAAPDGQTWVNTAGNLGLGTSGSGDTLSGVIAGLCARGADPVQAAVWGVYLHAKAGDTLARTMGALGFLARELLVEIPRLLSRIERPR